MSLLPDCVVNNSQTINLKFLEIEAEGNKSFHVEDKMWEPTICNIPWKIVVESSDVKDGLKMLLTCGGSSSENWKLFVSRLLFKFDYCSIKTVLKSVGQFEFSSTANTAEVILSQEDINSFWRREYCPSTLIITLSITLMWTKQVGLGHLFPISYEFHNRSVNSSLVIEISGERFFVNLEHLAQLSHYFAELAGKLNMLPLDEATGLRLLSLDDVDSWAFEEFLKVLLPSKRTTKLVDHTNFESIVELADRFKCPTVLNKCEKAVINMEETSHANQILLCDKHNMDSSAEEILGILDNYQIREIIDSPEFNVFSKRAMKLIFTRLARV